VQSASPHGCSMQPWTPGTPRPQCHTPSHQHHPCCAHAPSQQAHHCGPSLQSPHTGSKPHGPTSTQHTAGTLHAPSITHARAGRGCAAHCGTSRTQPTGLVAGGWGDDDDDDDWLHMGRRTRPQGASEPFGPLRARPTVNRPQPQPGVHRARAAKIPPGRGFWGTVQRSSTTTKQRTDNM
jgi:hypothetical protein